MHGCMSALLRLAGEVSQMPVHKDKNCIWKSGRLSVLVKWFNVLMYFKIVHDIGCFRLENGTCCFQ